MAIYRWRCAGQEELECLEIMEEFKNHWKNNKYTIITKSLSNCSNIKKPEFECAYVVRTNYEGFHDFDDTSDSIVSRVEENKFDFNIENKKDVIRFLNDFKKYARTGQYYTTEIKDGLEEDIIFLTEYCSVKRVLTNEEKDIENIKISNSFSFPYEPLDILNELDRTVISKENYSVLSAEETIEKILQYKNFFGLLYAYIVIEAGGIEDAIGMIEETKQLLEINGFEGKEFLDKMAKELKDPKTSIGEVHLIFKMLNKWVSQRDLQLF